MTTLLFIMSILYLIVLGITLVLNLYYFNHFIYVSNGIKII